MVWDFITENPLKFTHWPNPFPCEYRSWNVFNCGNYTDIDMEVIGGCLANFWMSEIFPSPVELARVSVTGKGRCGFKYKVRKGKPFSLLWGESVSPTRANVLAGIFRPVVTAAFAWWVVSSISEATAMVHSLVYASDPTVQQGDTMIIPGRAPLPLAVGIQNEGGLPWPEALCTTGLVHPANSNHVIAPNPGYWKAKAWNLFYGGADGLSNIKHRIYAGGDLVKETAVGNAGISSTISSSVEWEGYNPTNSVALTFLWDRVGGQIPQPTVTGVRFHAQYSPVPFDPEECDCMGAQSLLIPGD